MTVERLVDRVHWVVFIFHVRAKHRSDPQAARSTAQKGQALFVAPHWIPRCSEPPERGSLETFILPGLHPK